MEDRKGYRLLLHAVHKLVFIAQIPIHLVIGGQGLELDTLKLLVRQLDLCSHVTFQPTLSTSAFYSALRSSHVFAFPSLRDNSPITLLEAMAAGCVPLVLCNGGPGDVVKSRFGVVLSLKTPEATINEIATELERLWRDEKCTSHLSRQAVTEIRQRYLACHLQKTLSKAYALASRSYDRSE